MSTVVSIRQLASPVGPCTDRRHDLPLRRPYDTSSSHSAPVYSRLDKARRLGAKGLDLATISSLEISCKFVATSVVYECRGRPCRHIERVGSRNGEIVDLWVREGVVGVNDADGAAVRSSQMR